MTVGHGGYKNQRPCIFEDFEHLGPKNCMTDGNPDERNERMEKFYVEPFFKVVCEVSEDSTAVAVEKVLAKVNEALGQPCRRPSRLWRRTRVTRPV